MLNYQGYLSLYRRKRVDGQLRLMPPERIFLVPTGVAPRPTSAEAVGAFRTRYGLGDDPVVLFVGRVNREKGVDLLLSAWPGVRAACPRARLVLVGAVYEPRWLAGLIPTPDVVVTGQLPPDDVAAAYGAAKVFAFPSRTDTQALVLQEAALAGVAAVLVDQVLHCHGPLGGAGLLTEPNRADLAAGIVRLMTDPVEADRVRSDAAARAARHTPARYAATMLDVYRGAADRRAGSVAGRMVTPVP